MNKGWDTGKNMRMMSLASGSSGNCTYIGAGDTHILIDAGISAKRIEAGLKEAGVKAEEVSAVFLTHEHCDHVQGLPVFARKHHIPIFGTKGTLDAFRVTKEGEKVEGDLFSVVKADCPCEIGEITVKPFSISHDAAEPVGYRMKARGKRVAVATDIGTVTDYIVENLTGLNALLLEANHDRRMLEVGPYPYPLKRRILSDHGHLCNEQTGQLLGRILNDDLKYIFLGHLSKDNNYPALACETVRTEVTMGDNAYRGEDLWIEVAARDTCSSLVEF